MFFGRRIPRLLENLSRLVKLRIEIVGIRRLDSCRDRVTQLLAAAFKILLFFVFECLPLSIESLFKGFGSNSVMFEREFREALLF